MTYRQAQNKGSAMLDLAGIESARAECRLLMEYASGTDLEFYLLHGEDEMPAECEERFFSLVGRRCERVPLQYLTGEAYFMGLRICVNEHVLIPRQDTEILAQEALKILRDGGAGTDSAGEKEAVPRILDLCTGSGCVAICISSIFPNAYVCGSDISGEALKTAEENARLNRVSVRWVCSDLFTGIRETFDLITCNPPYIPTDQLDTLMPEVRNYEPVSALDGGPDGLTFYRRIIGESKTCLNPGGSLLLEIGSDQADDVCSMMRENGFGTIEVKKDLAGFDRVVSGSLCNA